MAPVGTQLSLIFVVLYKIIASHQNNEVMRRQEQEKNEAFKSFNDFYIAPFQEIFKKQNQTILTIHYFNSN